MPLNWSSGPLLELSELLGDVVVNCGDGVVEEPTEDVDDIKYSVQPGFSWQ
jgi:hypothetical protein